MAAKSNQRTFEPSVFVQWELNKADKENLRKLRGDAAQILDSVAAICDSGYKITCKADDYTGGYACWIIPELPKHENAGKILSGRGSSADNALAEAIYKYAALVGEPWPEPSKKGSGKFWDTEK